MEIRFNGAETEHVASEAGRWRDSTSNHARDLMGSFRHAVRVLVYVLCVGSLNLVVLPAAAQSSDLSVPAILKAIRSDDLSERTEALVHILKLRARLIDGLSEIAAGPVEHPDPFTGDNSKRNIAIYLLGKMGAEEAIPVLLENLEMRRGQLPGMRLQLMVVPAHAALAEIGPPALPHLLEQIREKYPTSLSIRCLQVLLSIEGSEKAAITLANAIQSEDSEEGRKRLEAALADIPSMNIVSREVLTDMMARALAISFERDREQRSVLVRELSRGTIRQWSSEESGDEHVDGPRNGDTHPREQNGEQNGDTH